MNTILGQKIGMGQVFVKDLKIPVTKIIAGPCVVLQVKKIDADGYWAVQLGFASKKFKNTSKSLQGHFAKSQKSKTKDQKYPRFLKEVKFKKEPEFKVGDEVLVSDVFKKGDIVSVSGISKGKGFAGGVKRWGFAGGPKTHGQSDRERAPGSIGAGTTPGRVLKGKKMAGRMGGSKVTVKNLHVVDIDQEKNQILVTGPVPGVPKSLIILTKTASGSLDDLEKEVVASVVESEEVQNQEDDKGETKNES